MVILDIIVRERKVPYTRKKDGKTFLRKRTATIYVVKCDACGKIVNRHKGDAYRLRLRGRHACSPECIGKLERKPDYSPKPFEQKNGYIYLGQHREHRLVVEETLGRRLHKEERVHHIDGDKGSNHENNLIVCRNTTEHNAIHKQLERLSFLLFQKEVIKFCRICKSYYTQNITCVCQS